MSIMTYESHLECPVEALFDFFSRPANVTRVTDPALGITFASAPEVLQLGSTLEFQLITYGQVVKAVHKIIQIERPHLVVEQQITGPMRAWVHRHEYEATENGCIKRDFVEFQLPGGLIGLLLSESKVRDHLEDGFFYREQRLKELIAQGQLR
jgi:ligand-binding SRPBCC domain-containing protein